MQSEFVVDVAPYSSAMVGKRTARPAETFSTVPVLPGTKTLASSGTADLRISAAATRKAHAARLPTRGTRLWFRATA